MKNTKIIHFKETLPRENGVSDCEIKLSTELHECEREVENFRKSFRSYLWRVLERVSRERRRRVWYTRDEADV